MKKKVNEISVKSIQMLGRFGNYSYFCRCQGVTDRLGDHSSRCMGGL